MKPAYPRLWTTVLSLGGGTDPADAGHVGRRIVDGEGAAPRAQLDLADVRATDAQSAYPPGCGIERDPGFDLAFLGFGGHGPVWRAGLDVKTGTARDNADVLDCARRDHRSQHLLIHAVSPEKPHLNG